MYALAHLLLVIIAIVYVASAVFAFGLVLRWWRARRGEPFRAPIRRSTLWLRATIFCLAGLGVVAMSYAYFVEPYWPDVTSATVHLQHVRPRSRIRIVQLTDLHSDPEPRLEDRLPDIIAKLEPDIIVFTGDALNHRHGAKIFRRTLTRLASIAPTYAVRGNWDVWYWEDVDLYGGTGVHELNGETATVHVNGNLVHLVGLAVDDPRSVETVLASIPKTKDRVTIFLHHYPEHVEAAAAAAIDLMLAGDTHGGQVRLPLIGPLIKMSRFGGYHDIGLHRIRATHLYVNRGVGMEGGAAPRMRFLCRPEVAVIDVLRT